MTALLTIPEAAGRLAVAPRTVRRMLAAGELTRVTIRRAVRRAWWRARRSATSAGPKPPADHAPRATTDAAARG